MNTMKSRIGKIPSVWRLVIGGSIVAGLGVFLQYQLNPQVIGEAVFGVGFVICFLPAIIHGKGEKANSSGRSPTEKWKVVSIGLAAMIIMIIAVILLATTKQS